MKLAINSSFGNKGKKKKKRKVENDSWTKQEEMIAGYQEESLHALIEQ